MKRLFHLSVGCLAAGVLLIGASAASADPGNVVCNGTVTGDVPHDLIVPAGDTFCFIPPGTQIGHDVIVQPGGRLWDQQGSVGHDITANQPAGIAIGGFDTPQGGSVGHDITILGVTGNGPRGGVNWLCNTHVGHDVTIANSASTAGKWDIGDLEPECGGGGITTGHDLNVVNNANQVDVSDNNEGLPPPPFAIGHDLNVLGNALPPIVESNSARHDANCQSDHTTDGDGVPNVAGHNNSCV
jgi:plastocyanin